MEGVDSSGQMVKCTKGCSREERCMEKVLLFFQMARKLKVDGSRESILR